MAEKHFVICISNLNYEASLERWKLYEVIKDEIAEAHNQIRVIDESGEDYLFPKEYFEPIELPKNVLEAMNSAKVF
jgi:hypothetical protein